MASTLGTDCCSCSKDTASTGIENKTRHNFEKSPWAFLFLSAEQNDSSQSDFRFYVVKQTLLRLCHPFPAWASLDNPRERARPCPLSALGGFSIFPGWENEA